MAIKSVVKDPDPRLRLACRPIDDPTSPAVRALYIDLRETLDSQNALGIAANQLGDRSRMFLVEPVLAGREAIDSPMCFINPHIIESSGELEIGPEGCLSMPGRTVMVPRFPRIKVRALDLKGQEFEVEATGLFARCIQHEIDHLDGIVMTDHI